MVCAYSVHGLEVHVDLCWPELTDWTRQDVLGRPDVRVTLDPAQPLPDAVSRLSWERYLEFSLPRLLQSHADCRVTVERAQQDAGSFFRLSFALGEGSVAFVIDPSGSDVWVRWQAGGEERRIRRNVAALLQGFVWGAVLRFRGMVWLHGAAVAVGGKSVILLGSSGAGKSTLSAALAAVKGARLLADDKAIIQPVDGKFFIGPGERYMRLRPESVEAMAEDVKFEVHEARELEKLRVTLVSEGGIHEGGQEAPLSCVYILEPREPSLTQTSIEPLPAAGGLYLLLAHRYGLFAATPAQIARDYALLSEVAATVPTRRLHRPDSLKLLPETVSAILSDLAGNASSH